MSFELNKRLVIIDGENNGGSAILINNQGLVISCYHNFYDNTTNEPNIIKSLNIKTEGFWVEIPYSNNVVFCFKETKYDDLEFDDIFLFRLKIDKNPNGIKNLPKLSVSRNVNEGDEVTVVAWDNIYDKNLLEHSGKVITIEPKTEDHPNRFHIKLDGYPGYSGGGVFNNNGKLIGIINYTQTQRHNNIIASFIPNYIIDYIDEEIEIYFNSKSMKPMLKQQTPIPNKNIANLSKITLATKIQEKFNREEISLIWLQLFGTRMDDEMPNKNFLGCITELLSFAEKRGVTSNLHTALITLHKDIEELFQNPM